MTTKTCTNCNEPKPLNEFGINRKVNTNNFHGGMIVRYKGKCKVCLAIESKTYRAKNPNSWKKYKKNAGPISKYSKDQRWLISAIRNRISTARQNSKRNPERLFNIDTDYMYQLWKAQKGICVLTGVEIQVSKNTPLSLSIDKIIPCNGYVKGNVQWVCWAANRAKGDMNMKSFINMCNKIVKKCRDYP